MRVFFNIFVSLRCEPRRYPALAVKYTKVNFVYLARLLVSLKCEPRRYPALAVKYNCIRLPVLSHYACLYEETTLLFAGCST